jgi:anti-sigma-K factor RskA
MNYERNPELIERLAAQYALGTLRGRARLRFARLARENAAVARALREWENRLGPMSLAVAEVRPHRRVWKAIQARLPESGGRWDSLAFWRNLGLVLPGCAACGGLRRARPALVGRSRKPPRPHRCSRPMSRFSGQGDKVVARIRRSQVG